VGVKIVTQLEHDQLPSLRLLALTILNSVAVGAWFNVLNPGQMLMWHIVLLPLVVVALTAMHVILVRRHGVVPPIDAVLEG
jgi:ubiquinol-cytochrome c reductase cytochrome b subunit